MAGRRFFGGDVAGVENTSEEEILVDARVRCFEEALGEGVRWLERCAEMRADFRGEKGSQESA